MWCFDWQHHSVLTYTQRMRGLLLFVTVCLGSNTHCKGGWERRRRRWAVTRPPWKVIAFPLLQCVCVRNILSLCCCVTKRMRLRGDLYARGAIENCLLRHAALMSLPACVPEAIRRSGAGWGTGGLCCVTGMTVPGTAQLFNHRMLASALFREAGTWAPAHTALCSRE